MDSGRRRSPPFAIQGDEPLLRGVMVRERRGLHLANQALTQHVGREYRELSPVERERHRLEQLEPGITTVRWGPDGEVVMEP
jgi:hypothetical protein